MGVRSILFLVFSLLFFVACYGTLVSTSNASDEVVMKIADELEDMIKNPLDESQNDSSLNTISQEEEEIDIVEPLLVEDKAEVNKSVRAKIIILNKITTKSEEVIMPLEKARFFGNLSIEVNKCIKKDDIYWPDNLMLITVFDHHIEDDHLSVFHGWLSSLSPAVMTLEHPVYEIIPRECIVIDPDSSNK